jgi:hypothetical protein
MEAKFKEGEIVIERIRPMQNLIVRGYVNMIYYCNPQEHLSSKELVYFERDLMSAAVRVRAVS